METHENDDDKAGCLKHEYPPNYMPGTHWATDEAWKILDHIKPGVIPNDVRFYIAGAMAGVLMRLAEKQ